MKIRKFDTYIQETYCIRKQKNNNVYELFYKTQNNEIRVATYSCETKNIVLTNPEIFIPDSKILIKLIGYTNKL